MIATVQKWGNSLGIRIPKTIAEDSEIREGVSVRMQVKDGRVILEPQAVQKYHLVALLKSVSRANLHGEVGLGDAVGKEVW